MAIIGNYGSAITFGVFDPYNDSGNRMMIRPEDISRDTKARWTNYPLIKKKPLLEFQGADLDEFELKVVFCADYGVTPLTAIEALRTHLRMGYADYLVIGGRLVGDNPYVLESISEDWDEIWDQGQLFKATVSLKFKEYPEISVSETAKKSKKKNRTIKLKNVKPRKTG